MLILLPLVVIQTTETKKGHKSKENGCIQTGKVAYSLQLLRVCAGAGAGGGGGHPILDNAL